MAASDAGDDLPPLPLAFKWTHSHSEQCRKMFLDRSRLWCKEKVEAYVECTKAHGMMAALKCREQNKAMNACTAHYNTPENLQNLIASIQKDWAARGVTPSREAWDAERRKLGTQNAESATKPSSW